jgi:hypothetical protein
MSTGFSEIPVEELETAGLELEDSCGEDFLFSPFFNCTRSFTGSGGGGVLVFDLVMSASASASNFATSAACAGLFEEEYGDEPFVKVGSNLAEVAERGATAGDLFSSRSSSAKRSATAFFVAGDLHGDGGIGPALVKSFGAGVLIAAGAVLGAEDDIGKQLLVSLRFDFAISASASASIFAISAA